MRAAMALSILTVQEDDRRRKEKWGINAPGNSVDLSGKSHPSVGARSSAPANIPISIPRPGSSGSLIQKQKSQLTPKSSPPSGNIARPRPQSTKSVNKDSGLGLSGPPSMMRGAPIGGDRGAPPPLPSVGPNAKSSQYLSGSGEESLSPVLQPPPRSPRSIHKDFHQPQTVRMPMANSSRNSLNPYNFEPRPLISLSPPQDLFDFDISSLDPLCSKSTEDSLTSIATTDGYVKEPAKKGITIRNPMFDLQRPTMGIDLQRQTGGIDLQRPTGGIDLQRPTGGAMIPSVGSYNKLYGMTTNHTGTTNNAATLPLQTGAQSALAIGPTHPKALPDVSKVASLRPSNVYMNTIDLKAAGASANHQPYCISGATPSGSTLTLDGTASSSSQSSTPSSYASTPQVSTASSTSGDLMDFGMNEDDETDPGREFLSLEMFDPLYRVDQANTRGSDTFETLAVAHSEDQALRMALKESVASTEVSMIPEDDEFDDAPRPRAESTESEGELQDPFEMTALTGALEKKRAQHAKEQAQREAILRHKEVDRPKVEAQKRQAIIRRNSHMERGKVLITLCYFHK